MFKNILLGTLLFLFVITIFGGFEIVNSGNKGLRFTMGSLSNTIENEGIVFKIPLLQEVKEVTIQPIQIDYTVEVGPDGAISKDNQTIGANITIFYKYSEDRLADMWRNFGEDRLKSILTQTLRENFKKTIGAYTIFDIANIQEKIRLEVSDNFKADVNRGNYPVVITEIKIVNYDWSPQFDAQIQETMSRAQQVKQKEQELLIAQNEQQKKVKEAEAEKQALITKAEGEKEAAKLRADAKALEGEGIRKYNESVATNWNIELKKMELEIEKNRVEKWNGIYVPNNMYGPIPVDTVGGLNRGL